MSRLANMPTRNIAGNIPADHAPNTPGEWCIIESAEGARSFWFGCPLKPGGRCHVNIKPHFNDAHGVPSWSFDGNMNAPTLSPSIDCIKDEPRSYGCGWHGHVRNGEFGP